jgi:hypothetical protein
MFTFRHLNTKLILDPSTGQPVHPGEAAVDRGEAGHH